jgi:hypothetical protein
MGLIIRPLKMVRLSTVRTIASSCWKKPYALSSPSKWRFCPLCIPEFIVSEILWFRLFIALTAHHTPTFIICNDTMCISLELSADPYLLFWIFASPIQQSHLLSKLITDRYRPYSARVLGTWRHLAAKVGTSKGRGKQWQTTPKNLPRMQRARAIPVAWLGSGTCQNRPKGWILMMMIVPTPFFTKPLTKLYTSNKYLRWYT